MKKDTLTNQVTQIMKKLDSFPMDLVEIRITQSILSSKLTSINKETIEKILNTCFHHIKNHFGKQYEKIEVMAYRIDLTPSDIFSFDFIQHRIILIGNGINKKIPVLRESLNTYVKSKMGDVLSVYEREKQRSEEVYLYLINQSKNTNSQDKLERLSDKTNSFYHPDLYEFSNKGWHIFVPREIKSSFIVFK
jgi:hypothetical protein